MKQVLLSGVFAVLFLSASYAQDSQEGSEKKGFDKSRLFVGGNLGFSFSSYSTAINVMPQAGYFFSRFFAAGVSLNYSYYKYTYYSTDFASSYAGIGLFGRFYPIRSLFIQVQPEANYVWGNNYYSTAPDGKVSEFVPTFLVGGGAAIPAGPGSIVISIMYDVLQKPLSPYYAQAVYGFGYNIGF